MEETLLDKGDAPHKIDLRQRMVAADRCLAANTSFDVDSLVALNPTQVDVQNRYISPLAALRLALRL